MEIQHLLNKQRCKDVEESYGINIVYQAFRSPCLAVANEAKTFALHPADLFYECMWSIDYLKQISYEEKEEYFNDFLESTIKHFKKEVKNVDEDEIALAVCMVMQALAEWLIRSGNEFLPLVKILKEQMGTSVSLKLNTLFQHGLQCVKEKEIADYMAAYMTSEDDWISEELEYLLYGMEFDELCRDPEHSLHIADGKKRSVVVALKAILESDWVVDVNGKRPKNIEKIINEILQSTFSEKKKTYLSQTVIPSNDNDPQKSMNHIAKELSKIIKSFATEKK